MVFEFSSYPNDFVIFHTTLGRQEQSDQDVKQGIANQPSRIGRRLRTTGLQSGICHRPYGLERPPSPLKAESVWCDLEPDFSSKDPKLPSFSCQNSRCCIALPAALSIPPLGRTICSCTQSASPAPIRIDPKGIPRRASFFSECRNQCDNSASPPKPVTDNCRRGQASRKGPQVRHTAKLTTRSSDISCIA